MTEVGPRDGLQNEARMLATSDKVKLIGMLAAAGIGEMEVTSFVSPMAVPNLADAEQVMAAAGDLGLRRIGLVANTKGYERARAAGTEMLTLVMSATESHNRSNLNCSVAESMERLGRLREQADEDGMESRLALSVVFGCPFEGDPGLEERRSRRRPPRA